MCGEFDNWAEDWGRACAENGADTKGAVYRYGRKDREEAAYNATKDTPGGLFEAIGEYFRVRAQVEQMETPYPTSGMERFAPRGKTPAIERIIPAQHEENILAKSACERADADGGSEKAVAQQPGNNGNISTG